MKNRKSGRVTALLLSAVLTLCLLPLPVKAAGAETGVQLGDYIQLGRYDGEPILWRCVSVDENGPLMLSDKVLCDSMPYDAQTSENSDSGSHRRSSNRSKYGSNHWRDSDMRSWLNSDADAGQVEWLCGNPPKDGYIVGGGAYDGKAGFLNGFTPDEAAAIKTVTQRSIVSHPEYTAGYIDAPGTDLPYNTDIGSVADGYEGAHYENITDKVFLLDVKQLHTVYENLGGYYIGQNRNGVNWSYWLRTPVTDCNHDMRYVSPQGSIGRDAPCKGYYGVRPAFYLDAAYYAVTSGSGTAADPYVGAAPGKPADSTTLSPAERDTGDGNWDVDTETYLQVEMSERYTTDREYANPTIPVYVIQKPRSDTENMVILFCAEGYTKSQQADFIKDVQRLWQATLNTEPYRSMADRFNVYALCTASKDGFNGSSTFFQANKNGISVNFGGWRNHILERIIGTAFIEKIHDAHIPNTTMPEADEYRQYDYVYEHINQFVVLANSGEYFGGSHDEIKSGIHYILAAAKSSSSPFILRHELGHGLFHLGDEYATSSTPVGEESYRASLNISHTADPTQVKWKNMLGFRHTYSCPHTDNSYVYNSSFECLMRENTRNEFCDVCTLQGTKRMSQLISDPPALYAAVPEVKLYTGEYKNPTENSDAYRQADSSGYWKYQTDRENRLLSGSGKDRFSPDMKGREIELRTIVQNLSDTEEQTVTLRLWVRHADGSRAVTADGGDVWAEKVFTVPVWSEKSKFWPKGALEYTGSDFDSGLVNCSLVYRIPENAQLQSGDTIGFEVVDGAGNTLATDGTENQSYTDVTIQYELEDGTAMPNTAPSVLPVPTGASVNWQPPQTLNGHTFVNMKDNGSTVTFVYQETLEQPEVKTYTVRYDWGEAPSDRTLPTDSRAYRSVEQAMDAVDTTFTADSTSNAQNGGLTGTWAFSGWDGGTLEGTTVVFRGTWRFTPDGGSAGGTTPSQPGGSTGGSSGGGGSSSGSSGGSSSGGGGSSSSDKPSASTGKTETTTKPDGTKVETVTKPDGTTVKTETKKDGSVSKTESKPDGSSVTETKAADGSAGTVKTDKHGQTTAETTLSGKAVEDAKKNGEAVKAPVEVKATRNSNTAPVVKVELPQNSGETKVEIPVSNVKPGTVAVLVHPDGTEEILKDSIPTEDGIQLTVNGGATVKIVDNSKDFADTRNHWAKDAIDFVSARGLVNGMNETTYAPNASTTRAQLWTILARQNDANLNGGNTWFENAQNWAKEKDISDGANPNAAINRAQMVTMLWRAEGQPAVGRAANFIDVPADTYYAGAVSWAVENGITTGVGGGRFAPAATCTRAQIAAFLARSMK
ncbi:M64 family metallopeptidase [Dysosmobacter sp.]|uniref:M64 family metallopeptidase n=1 Tax=Dysosmobacter sp. TaxID=2591382 RepID=UPI003AF00978